MKKLQFKKSLIILGAIMTIIMFTGNIIKSNAAEELPDTLYVKLSKVLPGTDFGYAIGNPTVATGEGKTIWNLVSYTGDDFNSYNDFSKTNLYCLKAGAGFYTNGVSDANAKKTYTKLCSISDVDTMKASTHTYVAELANSANYNAIRWILDNAFIKGESTLLDKKKMLYEAGITQVDSEGDPIISETATGRYYYFSGGEYDYYESGDVDVGTVAKGGYATILTDDDLVAMQQAAIWYFTNGTDAAYNKYAQQKWENVTENGGNSYATMSTNYAGREEQSRIMYKYLIDAATANASEYTSVAEEDPVTITKTNAQITEVGDNYVVGPINITKNNDISYSIEATVKNQDDGDIDGYKYTDANGVEKTGFNINTYTGDFYVSVPKSGVTKVKINFNLSYDIRDTYIYVEDGATSDQPIALPQTTKKEVPVEAVLSPDSEFDLKLIKRISKVGNTEVDERLLDIDSSKLKSGEETTAYYQMQKNPVTVKKGDLVTYTIRVYNESDIDGYAQEITEDIPEGLEFVSSENPLWTVDENNSKHIKTTALSKETSEDNLIKAYDKANDNGEGSGLSYKEITIVLKVTDNATGTIRNEAEISEDWNSEGITDRDSDTEQWKKEDSDKYYNTDNKWKIYKEDDEDYDNIIIEEDENPKFDLKLIKKIVKVNDKEIEERLLSIDSTKLKSGEETTADYKMNKNAVLVANGDIVTYTFKIFNEGELDGYAEEITEDIPEGLEFIWSDKEGEELKADTTLTDAEKKAIEFNQSMLWKYADTSLKTISTDYLSKASSGDNLIKAFDAENDDGKGSGLSSKEVSVMLKVTAPDSYNGIIRNEAEISKDWNSQEEKDRDSDTDKWVKYEDDEDYDNIKLQYFDLALRKFITAIGDENVTTRIPAVTYKDKKIVYTHPKDPLTVHVDDIVTYTIRVYNEGKIDGYAEEVTDDIPDYLEYLPDNDTNKEFRWIMKDEDGKEVTDVTKATKLTTDYLSSEQEETAKRDNLLKAFDSSKDIDDNNPDYRDIKIAFKVKDPNSNTYIIINHAQISEDSDDDIDSTPGKWNEGEDDQDIENVKVNYFDLALRKYVTKAIVIENGKQKVTNTGHKAEDDPESIVKVELHRKKLSSVTVKFVYKIKITNEGDIEGYAKEIKDYIPQGLKFVASDNPLWKDEGNNVISTKQLENTLLQPGESTEVEVVLTWINGANNTGLKVNTAEISEDWNEYGIPDRDSTPDNKKPGEDDIDDAPVMLSISTGQARIYYGLGATILAMLAGGIFLIRKYVV